jgi:cation:H+ antiporter
MTLLDALLYLVALLLSFLIIAKAGDIFVDSACAIARGLNVPRAVMGLTIVSFATTLPEFTTSNFASVLGNVEIAYGNAVGTCIFNGAFILGVAALISAISVDRERSHEGLAMLGFGVLVTLLALDGGVSPLDGLLLLLALVIFLRLVLRREIKRRERVRVTKEVCLRRPFLMFILGAVGVLIGARLLIYSGVGIAALFGVP